MKAKYHRERKSNGERADSAVNAARFSVAACTELARIVKQNGFRLKDEEYHDDSGEELERQKAELEEAPRPDEAAEFDPLGHFKLDQIQDIDAQIAVKREEDGKLEEWRRRRKKARSDALRQFKEEQDQYRLKRTPPPPQQSMSKEVDGRALNESERALQRGQELTETVRAEEAEDDNFEFDPFVNLKA